MSQKQIRFQGFESSDKHDSTLKRTWKRKHSMLKCIQCITTETLFTRKEEDDLRVRAHSVADKRHAGVCTVWTRRVLSDHLRTTETDSLELSSRRVDRFIVRLIITDMFFVQDENGHNHHAINGEVDSLCLTDTLTVSSYHQQNQLAAAANGLLSLSSSFAYLATICGSSFGAFLLLDSLLVNNEDNPNDCHSNSLIHDGTANGAASLICGVCQDRASGKHYGVLSCEVTEKEPVCAVKLSIHLFRLGLQGVFQTQYS